MSVVLNAQQRRVFDLLTSRSGGCCLITGDAGTGKTTLAAEVARSFLRADLHVLILCPTHVAKRQFAQRLRPHEHLELTTVAAWLKQHPTVEKESGRLKFRAGGYSGVHQHLVIVDESSMVSEYELLEIRKARADALVVFLGDFAQLRPVMKRQGDAYQRLKTFHLTQQMRNANEILALCNRVRHAVEYPTATDGMITVHDGHRALVRAFLRDVGAAADPRDACYVAYRNRTVNRVRMLTHVLLHGDVPFARGQWLRLDQQCEAGHNGSMVRVLRGHGHRTQMVGREQFRVWDVGVRNHDVDETYVLPMACLADQPRFAAALEALYEASAAAFARDKSRWQMIRKQIDTVTAIVRHSSPYVGTVHKSQGRSVPRVFVDTLDISSGSDKRRLLYVAYSRAMHELHTAFVPPKSRRG